jgi:agmatine deiminase
VVWLTGALDHDNTGGHIDNLACFTARRVVVALTCDDPQDPQYDALQENLRRLRSATDARGRALEVVELAQPARPEYGGRRLSPSYVNFYVADGGVVMPGFGDRRDEEARDLVAHLFPSREIVQLPTLELAKADGNVHCVTQQQPAA